MPWQHEQLSVTVQTITLWLYCSPGDEFHHELIWDQFSTPKTKPLPLQVLVSDQWQSTTSFMTPAATNTSLPPKISHFPATKRQESRSAWQAKKLQDLKIKPLHRNHAVCGETSTFLVKFCFMCSWSGYIGFWDVDGLGRCRLGLRSSREWSVQWNLQSQNWPFQWHRNQNQMPQDWLTWKNSER